MMRGGVFLSLASSINTSWNGSALAMDIINQKPSFGGAVYAFSHLIPEITRPFIKNRYGSNPDRRWSLFSYAWQPDRYFAVDALSRVPGLIRARK